MDLEEIKSLVEMVKDSDITDLQLEKEGYKIRLKREKIIASYDVPKVSYSAPQPAPQAVAPPAAGSDIADNEALGLVTVTAPLVGTFYKAASPDTESFAEVGDRVRKGQVICIVEAMKLMNEIESEVNGKVVKCLVDNGQPVEYGEPLFLVEPE